MANEDEFDYFQTGSGLPLAGADVTVTSFSFGYDASYADGEALVAIAGLTPDGGEEQRQFYSVGKAFEAADRGAAMVPKGRPVPINDQSNYGRWINQVLEGKNADEFRKVAGERKLQPNSAALWVGLRFHMDGVKYPDFNDTAKTRTYIMPTEFLGVAEDVKVPAKVTGGAKKASPKPPAAPADNPIIEAAIEIAKTADSFEEFLEAAMQIEGVDEDAVAQKAIMSIKPDGIFHTYSGK